MVYTVDHNEDGSGKNDFTTVYSAEVDSMEKKRT